MRGALEQEGNAFVRAATALSGGDFSRPTRLPAWNVLELIGHVWRGLDRVRWTLSQPPPASADHDAVSYWRSYDRASDGATAERAKNVARRSATGEDLVREIDALLREGLSAAAAEADDRVIATWGPTLRLDEFLATRVVELTIHGLDLAESVGRRPWATGAGISVTRGVLVRALGSEPPAVQAMDDTAFFELATGRRPVTASERARLGAVASRFPLLS